MVFNSYFFILVFLPILLIGWYGLNRVSFRAADLFLIGMSLWFYGCFGWAPLSVLLVSIGMNYLFGRALGEGASAPGDSGGRQERPPAGEADGKPEVSACAGAAGCAGTARTPRRLILALGIAVNLLLLGWFKYVTPALSSAAAAGTIALPGTAPASLLPTFLTLSLPVGLSFYTFTQISYLVDRYRGEIPQASFLDYVLYASYFPRLAEGPITCWGEVMPQFRDGARRRFDAEGFARGLILFVFGLSKKLLIADTLSAAASYGFESAYYLDTLSVVVTLLCYVLQLYMDFSGFCEMAMGVSQMLNIRLPRNFDAPFRAQTFSGFWRRWHMTLTRFFTRYVYIPLGGSRRGTARTCLNILIVFVLSGLWHGTGLTYVVWGVLTGVLVCVSRQWQKRGAADAPAAPGKKHDSPPITSAAGTAETAAGAAGAAGASSPSVSGTKGRGRIPSRFRTGLYRLRTFALFLLTLVFFGSPNLAYSFVILRQLFVLRFPGWLYRLAGQMDAAELWPVNKAVSLLAPAWSNPVALAGLLFVIAVGLYLIFQRRSAVDLADTMRLSARNAVLLGILAVWCLCSLSGVSTYVYFQF